MPPATKDDETKWYWIAVNGPSCAASSVPMPATVSVRPTPEQLIGFRSREEQLKAQHFLLTAPIGEVEKYMRTTLLAKYEKGEVAVIHPKAPDPPTAGPTCWMLFPRTSDS